MGQAGFTSSRGTANAVRLPLCPRGSLPGNWPDGWFAGTHVKYRGDQHLPGAVCSRTSGGRSRCYGLGSGWVPHRQGRTDPGEHDHPQAATVLSRAQPDRESVALPAKPLLVESHLPRLPGFARRSYRGLARSLPRFDSDENRLCRPLR